MKEVGWKMLTKQRPYINWKIVFISIIIIAILACAFYILQSYRTIVASKLPNEEKVEKLIQQETNIIDIDDVTEFQEIDTIYIATGKNEKKEPLIAFIKEKSEDSKQYIKQYKQEELQSAEELVKEWKSECTSCILKKTNYAMIDKNPLLEITYEDEHKRYVFVYYSLEDGSVFEQMKLNRKYQ